MISKRRKCDLQAIISHSTIKLKDKVSMSIQLAELLYSFQQISKDEIIVHGDIKPSNILVDD